MRGGAGGLVLLRIGSLTASLVGSLAGSLAGSIAAQEPQARELCILHLNDLHGQIRPLRLTPRPGRQVWRGGYAALRARVQATRAAAGPRRAVWLTDGGDWFQGTPEGNEDRGWSIVHCFNDLGVTAAAIGNHEFDYGEQNLIRLAGRARFPLLAANLREAGAPRLRPYAKPYIVKQLGGVRIALLGLITSDTRNVSTGPFGAARFADERAILRALWPELRRAADQVILLTHCGLGTDRALARAFPELALILGGHSHTALHRGFREGRTWIAQSSGKGTSLSRVDCELDPRARRLQVRSVRLMPLAPVAPDAETRAFLDRTFAHIGPKWDRPLGVVRGAPDRPGRRSARSTPGGNFVAALIRREGQAELGITNKGGIRAAFEAGPITRRQIFQILPFDNTVRVFELSGAQLRAVLAAALQRGRVPLEIDGGRYSFRVRAGRRELSQVWVAGEPLQVERRYRVATNSFLAAGGDGLELLGKLPSKAASDRPLRAILLAHVQESGRIELRDDARIRITK